MQDYNGFVATDMVDLLTFTNIVKLFLWLIPVFLLINELSLLVPESIKHRYKRSSQQSVVIEFIIISLELFSKYRKPFIRFYRELL